MQRSWFTADRLAVLGLLLFTLLIRGAVMWAMRDNLKQDPDAYREIAENLLRHGEFARGGAANNDAASRPTPTAYRPPLYPVVLSNLPASDVQHVSPAKIAVLHLLLGLATVWLAWLTARRLLVFRVPCLFAAALVACDPLLLNQQTLVMTETLATFLSILSLWCLVRFDASRSWFNAALAGGAIGLAVLCRPTFLPWLGLVAMTMPVVRALPNFRFQISDFKSENVAWRLANLAGLVIAAAAVMSPWAIRNYRVFGKPIVTTTHGGYTIYLANNEWFYDWLRNDRTGLPWTPQLGGFRKVLSFGSTDNEIRYDRLYYAEATRAIQQRPYDFAISCLYRLGQIWSPLPNQLTWYESLSKRLLRYATCAWYCGVYALAAIGIWRLRWKLVQPPWIWGTLLCLVFTAVHTFYFTNMRMRAPLMPFIAIVTAAAIKSKPR